MRGACQMTWFVVLLSGCGSTSPERPDAGASVDAPIIVDGACPAAESIVASSTMAAMCADTSYARLTVAYATTSAANVLDLSRPAAAAQPLATVIWIHGGGWQSGNRTNVNQALRLVCHGFAVASIDYRLSGEARFPAQIHDVKAAIRFLRARASDYGLDPARFATFGSSAGGHLAALAGTSGGVAALEDLGMGNPDTSSAVQAAIDWYGPTALGQMDAQLAAQGCPRPGHDAPDSAESKFLGCTLPDCPASVLALVDPITHVDPSDPPFLIMHGDADCTVPQAQSVALDDALRAGSCPVRRTLSGAGHGGPAWVAPEPQDAAASFLSRVL